MNPSILTKDDFKVISESLKDDKIKHKVDLIIKMQELTENYQKEAGSIREKLLDLEK